MNLINLGYLLTVWKGIFFMGWGWKERGMVFLGGMKIKHKTKESPFPPPTFLSTPSLSFLLSFCLSLSLLTFQPLMHLLHLHLLCVQCTKMCTWQKEIDLNRTYRGLNWAPLTSLSIESFAVTNITAKPQKTWRSSHQSYKLLKTWMCH